MRVESTLHQDRLHRRVIGQKFFVISSEVVREIDLRGGLDEKTTLLVVVRIFIPYELDTLDVLD